MTPIETAALVAHSRSVAYQRRIGEAQDIIHAGLAACHAPYLACSFGKDSAVMLDLVRTIRPGIQARFIRWPETDLLANFSEIIEQWQDRGANIAILDLTRETLDEKVPGRWNTLRDLAPSDGVFMGLRAQEGLSRLMTLRAHGVIHRYPGPGGRGLGRKPGHIQGLAARHIPHQRQPHRD